MFKAEFPVKSSQTHVSIADVNVNILVQSYSNRLFVIVSEGSCGGTGTLVEFSREELSPELHTGVDQDSTIFEIKVLFGVEKPEVILAARVLGSKLYRTGFLDKPILFGIGLKKFDKPLVEEIGSALIEVVKEVI
jgi:hypothetical protein